MIHQHCSDGWIGAGETYPTLSLIQRQMHPAGVGFLRGCGHESAFKALISRVTSGLFPPSAFMCSLADEGIKKCDRKIIAVARLSEGSRAMSAGCAA